MMIISLRIPQSEQYASTFHFKSYNNKIFKLVRKFFKPMAIKAQMISLTHEKLHFVYFSGQEVSLSFGNVF